MEQFSERYKKLNQNQKRAVDTIDGPLMVIAGPGTGKTELLSVRVANILRNTDTLPENILCLTFTESGATAMRERLIGIIGQDAYKVGIHTFHSFGADTINSYGEYFYHGAHFRPADELSSYEVLRELFEKLPHKHPLAAKMNDTYSFLGDVQSTISDLKRSGLIPEELLKILDINDAFTTKLQPELNKAFSDRLSKKSFSGIQSLLDEMSKYDETDYTQIGYQALSRITHESLSHALNEAEQSNSTKPLSAWKKEWCEKRPDGELTFKDEKRSVRLRALAGMYYDYLIAMQKRELFDFDDMILRVVHAMELFDELRYNLQEKYQYILVDEFQDTNDAQMRVVWNLTNNEVVNSRPNLMVVGDDDQAIYRFQGANVSNILQFKELYKDVTVVALTDNYRSTKPVLDISRRTILQGGERLETILGIDKTLIHHHPGEQPVTFHSYVDTVSEYSRVVAMTKERFKNGSSIAIIARNHRELRALLPHLEEAGLPVTYERQDDVRGSEPVVQLELVARFVNALARQQFDLANSLLPQLLAHPAWGLSTEILWQLSLDASTQRKSWLELMLKNEGPLRDIAEWLIVASHYAQHESLEFMLDHLFGSIEMQIADTPSEEGTQDAAAEEGFVSPLRAHFFPHTALDTSPHQYLHFLRSLQTLRNSVREYRPDRTLTLDDFIRFLALHDELGLTMRMTHPIAHDGAVVTLLTAHKAKGLEFDEVIIVGLTDSVWGSSARTRGRMISFPHNLPLSPTGDTDDERLRLLYVAMTRAKNRLTLTTSQHLASGKSALPVGYLAAEDLPLISHEAGSIKETIHELQTDWRQHYVAFETLDTKTLLSPKLETYKLSATHLANYLNVTKGGPELFLLQNLLRFPQAMSPDAAYGSAMHAVLQRAHTHFRATGKRRPVEDILNDFDESLAGFGMTDDDYERYSARGSENLAAFLSAAYDTFTTAQVAERNFGAENIVLDGARLTGAIDLIDIDEATKTITVTDYKTGKSAQNWQGRTEYENIKLHHYQQQLMMYKLLIEHSRDYKGFTVTLGKIVFVEPDEQGEIITLTYEYDDETMSKFRTLLCSVWDNIQSLNFTLPENYEPTFTGIIAFERDMIDQKANS